MYACMYAVTMLAGFEAVSCSISGAFTRTDIVRSVFSWFWFPWWNFLNLLLFDVLCMQKLPPRPQALKASEHFASYSDDAKAIAGKALTPESVDAWPRRSWDVFGTCWMFPTGCAEMLLFEMGSGPRVNAPGGLPELVRFVRGVFGPHSRGPG